MNSSDWVSIKDLANDLQILDENVDDENSPLVSELEGFINSAISLVSEELNRPIITKQRSVQFQVPVGQTSDHPITIEIKNPHDLEKDGGLVSLKYWDAETNTSFRNSPAEYPHTEKFGRSYVNDDLTFSFYPPVPQDNPPKLPLSLGGMYVLEYKCSVDPTDPANDIIKRAIILIAKRFYDGEDLDDAFMGTIRRMISSHVYMRG